MWVVSPTFGTLHIFGCGNLGILWSDVQEITNKVLHEGGPYSTKADLHEESKQ